MKILYLITKSNWGGAQRYVYDLAIAAKEKGHEVTVAAGPGGPLLEKLERAGVHVQMLGSAQRDVSFLKDVKAFFDLMRLIKKTDADIVHANSSKLGGIGALAGLVLGKKTVFTAHGWPFQEKRRKVVTMLIWLFSWLTALLSWRVITPSANDFRLAQKMPFVGKKTRLVYLGRDVVFRGREESRDHLGSLIKANLRQDLPWVGVLAELHPNKGHGFLLEAATSINAQFFLIGGGELRDELLGRIQQNNLSSRVFLLGHVDQAASCLKAFDGMVLPSLKEGLPYTIIEAGLAGVPVLASNVGGIPEIIPDQAMLFAPGSSQKLQVAVTRFLDQKTEEKERIRSEFQEHVQARFSRGRMVTETLEVYQEVS